MSFKVGISSNKPATVPSGNLPKASSVGANTVNDPSPDKTPSNSAACSAATRVVNLPSSTAISTILLPSSSYIISEEVSSTISSVEEDWLATSVMVVSSSSSPPQAMIKTEIKPIIIDTTKPLLGISFFISLFKFKKNIFFLLNYYMLTINNIKCIGCINRNITMYITREC